MEVSYNGGLTRGYSRDQVEAALGLFHSAVANAVRGAGADAPLRILRTLRNDVDEARGSSEIDHPTIQLAETFYQNLNESVRSRRGPKRIGQ